MYRIHNNDRRKDLICIGSLDEKAIFFLFFFLALTSVFVRVLLHLQNFVQKCVLILLILFRSSLIYSFCPLLSRVHITLIFLV